MSEISKEKTGHILSKLEKKWTDYLTPKVPLWLDSKKLTLFTLLWCILVVWFGYLAKDNIHWLWGISAVIILEYLTDSLDGNVGRYRREGFIKWGAYMDKMVDWIFTVSLIVGYSFIVPEHRIKDLIFILGIYGAFMMHSLLVLATLNKYKISFFGFSPTEARLALITGNTLLVFFGRIYIVTALPYILGGTIVSVFITMYQTQRVLHREDIRELNKVRR